MCGIAGVVALGNISEKLVKSIRSLEYRGYDSCGIAIINGSGRPSIRKNIGSVEEVSDKESFLTLHGNVGIAHTRWATHGGVTKLNAHPHASCDGMFTVAHNGIISNYMSLRRKLEDKGHVFVSETDTESIAHLIEWHYTRLKSVEKAFIAALNDLDGTYAVALLTSREPDRIYCARKESPLILGLGVDENYIGSDFNAFIENTKSAVILDDNEYAIVTHDGYVVKRISSGEMVVKQVLEIMWDSEMAQKGGFPHYMLKEIHEQPQVVRAVMSMEEDRLMEFAEAMAGKSRLYLTGVGTTFYVAQFAQYYFSAYAGVTPGLVSSDEFRFMANVNDDTFVLAASQSGETYDTLTALRHARAAGAVTGGIVNVMGSSMARTLDHLILQGSGPEICVISTKAALSQMIIMARLALRLGLIRSVLKARDVKTMERELGAVPATIEKILNEKSGFIHTIAKEQSHIPHWLYLGRGRYYPIARESALKMKEVAYVHAEGMPSGFLKHGTIALIDDNLNCVVFMPPEEDEELYKLTLSSAEEIRARNGYVIGVMTEPKSSTRHLPFSEKIVLPRATPFTAPFFEMVAAQLFSYFTATTLKRNVDRPRALAKSVTVA